MTGFYCYCCVVIVPKLSLGALKTDSDVLERRHDRDFV